MTTTIIKGDSFLLGHPTTIQSTTTTTTTATFSVILLSFIPQHNNNKNYFLSSYNLAMGVSLRRGAMVVHFS